MRRILWIAPLVLLLAFGALVVIWNISKPTPTPPIQPDLPLSPTQTKKLTYYCANNKTIEATFKPSDIYILLSDNRSFTLHQATSGSGVRYEDTHTRYGTDVAFVGKGNDAFLLENDITTFADCTAATVLESDAPGYATYTDPGRTFSFAFPTNFSVAGSALGLAPGWSALSDTSGQILAKLAVPQSVAPGTNFVDSTFTVGTSADPGAVAACTKAANGAAVTPTKIGDLPATELTLHGAAAGNRYDSVSYRLLHDSQCYAIEYTIHYGVFENYPKGSIKAFNEQELQGALDEVAKSFQFIK